jgi:serine/threonine protein kinase
MEKFSFYHIPCGPVANESERIAFERLSNKLRGYAKEGRWIFLTNVPLSFHAQGFSDEIDILVVSAVGVTVIEVKHWDITFLKEKSSIAEDEAEKLNAKVKRVAGKLRKVFNVGFIEGRLLLTKTEAKLHSDSSPRNIRGITCYSLGDWKEILDVDKAYRFNDKIVEAICKQLEPKVKVALTGDVRTFAGLTNLELISRKEDRFHRVYKGKHLTRQDRIILHLFDLSATNEKNAENRARREYDTIQKLQKSPFLPRILDSFQYAPEYPGVLCFYSLVDPMVPSLADKAKDNSWPIEHRMIAAVSCTRALDSLHHPEDILDTPIIHRNITSRNIRIRSDNRPIFTELHVVKLPDHVTVTPSTSSAISIDVTVAPEIRTGGLSVADARTDVYALCDALTELFQGGQSLVNQALELLEKGLINQPEGRISLITLAEGFESLLSHKDLSQPEKLPISFEEDSIIPFQNSFYRIANRLGSGGIGQTFKVVQVDKDNSHEYGLFVAKVIADQEEAECALHAYRKTRPHSSHQHLAVIHEIAPSWSPETFAALMRWVSGIPLSNLNGVVSLHAEELGETPYETLVLSWLEYLSDALSSLHRANLVHGDVTPRNIIVSGGDITLIDYDAVIESGAKPRIDSAAYSSPNVQQSKNIVPSDDIFALATTFFHVLFDREPFRFGTNFDKSHGLNWEGLNADDLPLVVQFLRKATHADQSQRFRDGAEAKTFIAGLLRPESPADTVVSSCTAEDKSERLTPNIVPRLLDILFSYPGSLKGNRETRGLDTEFAVETYVETSLDQTLYEEIMERKVSLVILFGNAGDGKTAFLQHLAMKIGLPRQNSAERLWDHTLSNGIRIRANLDGSASCPGRSATELLNEFFEPFHDCNPPEDVVHLIAINSGPLLKWLEDYEYETYLTEQLVAVLEGDISQLDERFRLLDLNNRSLVGGINHDTKTISTDFTDKLLSKLIGDEATDLWYQCLTCTASGRCSAWESVQLLRNSEKAQVVWRRFDEVLQAVYQRGEIHITARELRAAASYIFFGLHFCADLHEQPELDPGHYYDRAFNPTSLGRQGDLLREMVYLDPALEAHPKIDSYLLGHGDAIGQGADQYPHLHLKAARRRAYFEWNPRAISRIAGDASYFGLAKGRHLKLFRRVPLMEESERNSLKQALCEGIARLEDLPDLAFDSYGIPLKIIPRTPTESALWVKKPFAQFSLQAVTPPATKGLETLHTHLKLLYRYKDGSEEQLLMGAELFHILLELKDGVQLSYAASADIFANLAIFTQRLAQENSRELYAWNPIEDDKIFRVGIKMIDGIQKIVCEPLEKGDVQ